MGIYTQHKHSSAMCQHSKNDIHSCFFCLTGAILSLSFFLSICVHLLSEFLFHFMQQAQYIAQRSNNFKKNNVRVHAANDFMCMNCFFSSFLLLLLQLPLVMNSAAAEIYYLHIVLSLSIGADRRKSFLICSTCYSSANEIKTPVRRPSDFECSMCDIIFASSNIRFHSNIKVVRYDGLVKCARKTAYGMKMDNSVAMSSKGIGRTAKGVSRHIPYVRTRTPTHLDHIFTVHSIQTQIRP